MCYSANAPAGMWIKKENIIMNEGLYREVTQHNTWSVDLQEHYKAPQFDWETSTGDETRYTGQSQATL